MTKETKSKLKKFYPIKISQPKSIKQFFRNIKAFFRYIKHFIQRGMYGVSDWDLGNLDMYLGDMLSNSLIAFAEMTTGCPYKYEKLYGEEESFDKWKNDILHMAGIASEMKKSFMDFADNSDTRPYIDKSKDGELKKQTLEKTFFNWMIENFDNLWD